MLKCEIIKLNTQDIITSSLAKDPAQNVTVIPKNCTYFDDGVHKFSMGFDPASQMLTMICKCGEVYTHTGNGAIKGE